MRRVLAILCMVSLWLSSAAVASAQTAPACQFVLGFKTLHDLIPDRVGNCVDNQLFAPNGDAQQHTSTGGLLVWRKVDNWTAFTDGYMTWINGPDGLVSRLNTERFPFEANEPAPQAPVAPAPPAPAASPTPAPTPAGPQNTANVVITDTGFVPDGVTIATGGTVSWVNQGTRVHSVTSITGPFAFDSGGLAPGATTSFRLTIPGSYGYDSGPDCLQNSGTSFVCKTYTVNVQNPPQ